MNKLSASLFAAGMVLTGVSALAQGSAAPGSKPGAFGAKEPANSSAIGERPAEIATPKTKRARAAPGNPAPNLAEQKARRHGCQRAEKFELDGGQPQRRSSSPCRWARRQVPAPNTVRFQDGRVWRKGTPR